MENFAPTIMASIAQKNPEDFGTCEMGQKRQMEKVLYLAETY